MSRNLVKAYRTIQDDKKPRVIDSNQRIMQILESQAKVYAENAKNVEAAFGEPKPSEFVGGLDAQSLEALTGDFESFGDDVYLEEGDTNVIKAPAMSKEDVAAAMEDIDQLRQQRIMETESDIALMKQQAQKEIEDQHARAYEEGRAKGYEDGMRAAREESQMMREALDEEKRRIEKQYEAKLNELEPQFIKTLTGIYEQIFKIDLSDEKVLVLNAVRNVMQRVEGANSYIIHVSREDYDFVSENKQQLIEANKGSDANIELVEDITMKSGDCMVETANGIFDCSIDVQLQSIRKKLMLLAYDGRE